jgi:tetratricopeptide (TPR) repeat protein
VLIAAARPYWQNVPAKERIKGADLVLILDVSQSMFSNAGEKGTTARIDQVRKFIKNLLPTFSGSQVALLYFAGDAQIGSPFTTDLHAISLMIDSITPGMTAQPGSKTETMEKVLKETFNTRAPGKLPVLLLFSDGEFFDNTRGFENYIKDENLRLFAYLSGEQKAPVLNYDLTAPVAEAFSTPDENSLRRLAAAGKGEFFHLSREPAKTIVKKVNVKIDNLIEEGQSVPDYRPVPFLVLGLLFLLLYQWIPTKSIAIRPGMAATIVILLATALSMKPEESRKLFEEAMALMKDGEPQQALEKLEALPPEFFPAEKEVLMGNIHYGAGKYEEAIRHYERAVQQNPFDTAARWNWEVALKRRSHPTDPPPQPKEQPEPGQTPQNQNALLQYVDQLEKEQRQKSNRANIAKSEFAW